jgi:hypothetical protein
VLTKMFYVLAGAVIMTIAIARSVGPVSYSEVGSTDFCGSSIEAATGNGPSTGDKGCQAIGGNVLREDGTIFASGAGVLLLGLWLAPGRRVAAK